MLDKNKLQNCRAASVSTCDVSELKDIRKIEIASAQPRANRAIGFLNQVGNPYLFKVGETVVKVEYADEVSAKSLQICSALHKL